MDNEQQQVGDAPKFLSKESILDADDRVYEDVYVERWGGYVRIHALTATQRDQFEASLVREVGKGKRQVRNLTNMRARLVALTATDDKNVPLFDKPEDVARLGGKNASEVNRLFEVAARLSGLSDEDVRELEGNSEEEDGTTSSSD